ncbi:hypothetical protein ACQ4LE_003558 [Meloidogyne hapla]
MIDTIKRLFINNKRSYSIDSCEEVVDLDNKEMTNFKEVIGHIVDCKDDYFTLVSTGDINYELYIAPNKRLLTPELNGYYQCEGTVSERDDGRIAFAVQSIKKLERGCKELEGKIPYEDYQSAQKLIHKTSGVSSLFSSQFFDKSLSFLPVNASNCSENVKDENVCDKNETAETITDENETDLNKTLKQENSDTKENGPVKVEKNENVPSIVLSIDNSKNFANLFAIGQNVPLIKISIKSLESPVQLGQWYSIKISNLKHSTNSSICYNNFAKLLGGKPPLKTKISASGVVQFLTSAILDKRTENGFFCFKSSYFPLIIDSSCLLNHYSNGISKVKFWCSLRQIPIGGIYWKVIKIINKYKKKLVPYIEEEKEKEEKKKRIEEERKREEEKRKEEEKMKEKIKQIAKERQKKNENGIFEGFVCGQLNDEYLVYLPEEKEIGHLPIKGKMDKLLGLWIQLQSCKINGKRVIEKFSVIEPKMLLIVTKENRVMFKSKIEIPSLNTSKPMPFCRSLGIYVKDNYNLLEAKHRGRSINTTIGCLVQPMENEQNLILWEILHIMEH